MRLSFPVNGAGQSARLTVKVPSLHKKRRGAPVFKLFGLYDILLLLLLLLLFSYRNILIYVHLYEKERPPKGRR